MKKGFTLIEIMIVVTVLAILGVLAYGWYTDTETTEHADRGVLPGKVNVVCIEGYEYLYVQSRWENYARAGLAPKFDKEGKPSKCQETNL